MIAGHASVVDGDTLLIKGQRIRLFGINAPDGPQLCYFVLPDPSAATFSSREHWSLPRFRRASFPPASR
jgi:endonuclease YncB( thermonuclease family)